MGDITAYLAVIGKVVNPIPSAQRVHLTQFDVRCTLKYSFAPIISDPSRDLSIDVSDCTIFTVTFADLDNIGSDQNTLKKIFEWCVTAISETIIWNKSIDVVGDASAFSRQIGTLDVKACLILLSEDDWYGWQNPIFHLAPTVDLMHGMLNQLMGGLFENSTMSNGPSSNPLPSISRRVMNSLDLINLGFYTESFINLFSLIDDLAQEVIKQGLKNRGMSAKEQKQLMRAIKEERLKIYLCNLAKLCDWISLEESNQDLFRKVMSINTKRNNIMHGSERLLREEAINSSNVLLELIDWLRSNPFGYEIPIFPLLKVAEVDFQPLQIKQPHESE